MSRKFDTRPLKWRVRLGGGDGQSTIIWARSAAYEGRLKVNDGDANISELRTRIGLSRETLHKKEFQERNEDKFKYPKQNEMKPKELKGSNKRTHRANRNCA